MQLQSGAKKKKNVLNIFAMKSHRPGTAQLSKLITF